MSIAIESWTNLLRAVILIGSIVALLVFGTITALNSFGSNQVLVEAGGTKIRIGNHSIDSILVSPRGITDTNIDLREGDKVIISASGEVNIAAGQIFQITNQLYKEIDKLNIVSTADPNLDNLLKEKNFELPFSWIDPTGDSGNISPVYRNNQEKYVQKSKNFIRSDSAHGALLAIVSSDGNQPKLEEDFTVHQIYDYRDTPMEFFSNSNGRLFLTINDEVFVNNRVKTQIAWQDNLGFFEAKIHIKRN